MIKLNKSVNPANIKPLVVLGISALIFLGNGVFSSSEYSTLWYILVIGLLSFSLYLLKDHISIKPFLTVLAMVILVCSIVNLVIGQI